MSNIFKGRLLLDGIFYGTRRKSHPASGPAAMQALRVLIAAIAGVMRKSQRLRLTLCVDWTWQACHVGSARGHKNFAARLHFILRMLASN